MSDQKMRIAAPVVAIALVITGGCSINGREDDLLDYTTEQIVYVEASAAAAPQLAAARAPVTMRRGLYATAGLGLSQLKPDTSEVDGVDVDDPNAYAGQLALGADLNKYLSVELHSADLGSAGLSPQGRINYHLHGGSALLYAGKNKNNNRRRGFTGFGRLGVAAMENSPIGPVNFEQNNKAHLLFGAGLEYNTRFGLGMRAELISFDTDAQYAQLGLMYRPPYKSDRLPTIEEVIEIPAKSVVAVPPPAPAPTVLPAVKPILPGMTIDKPKDTDNDGVADKADQCPGTTVRRAVDDAGCAIFAGTINGVTFKTASADLTDAAVDILFDASQLLNDYPGTHLTIKAHTDSHGNADRNQRLSERRARAVADYLAAKGFPYSQMTARAYGHRQPIDTNDTSAGRANNRRVELFANRPDR